jgi:hypothetical protein
VDQSLTSLAVYSVGAGLVLMLPVITEMQTATTVIPHMQAFVTTTGVFARSRNSYLSWRRAGPCRAQPLGHTCSISILVPLFMGTII